jgi:kynurenine formamidase
VSAAAASLVGVGVETVGSDAGAAHFVNPPFPVHSFLLGAARYGQTRLANLAQLPPTGTVVVVAPLKLVRGTGSPARVLAPVPRGCGAGPIARRHSVSVYLFGNLREPPAVSFGFVLVT